MRRVRLGDDGIARRNRRRKIAARHAVVGEGKIIRPEAQHRPDGREHGPDVQLRINHRQCPRAIERGGGGLAKLVGRARQFHVRETRRFGQRGFCVRGFDEFRFARLKAFGEARQEFGKLLRRRGAQAFGGGGSGVQGRVAIGPSADGKSFGQRLAGGGMVCVKSSGGLRVAPLAGEENGLR